MLMAINQWVILKILNCMVLQLTRLKMEKNKLVILKNGKREGKFQIIKATGLKFKHTLKMMS